MGFSEVNMKYSVTATGTKEEILEKLSNIKHEDYVF